MCLGLVEGVIGKIQLHTGKVFHKAHSYLCWGEGLCCGIKERCDKMCQRSVCRRGVGWRERPSDDSDPVCIWLILGWEKCKKI